MPRIKLTQLPIPELQGHFSSGNIPMAAGYLKSYLMAQDAAAGEIAILPRNIANYGGDAAVLQELLNGGPDLIGFTTYMWNLERNLNLAENIRNLAPKTAVTLGGPELDKNHPAVTHPAISSVVQGEGERPFLDLFNDLKTGRPLKKIYHNDQPLNLAESVNPYLSGALSPAPGESMFIETMRGCPYLCKYCFYSKSCRELRLRPDHELPLLFELARIKETPEIFIMDPSFDVTPALMKKLETIRACNPTGIPIHTEIRLENLTPEIAGLMKEAGFRSVEVGLQSINKKALDAVNRTWKRDQFIKGAQLLMERGIAVKTGVILGLPFDTAADFEKTLEFVMKLGLDEWLEVYVLSVLPGVQLREESDRLGIKFMNHPPYWVLETPHFPERELRQAVERMEYMLDMEFHPPLIPRFSNPHLPLVHFLDLRHRNGKLIHEALLNQLLSHPEHTGHSLTLLLDSFSPILPVTSLARELKQFNPSVLIQIVLDTPRIPTEKDLELLKRIFPVRKIYFDRLHHFKIDAQECWSIRFFHLTGDLSQVETHLYDLLPCDVMVKFSPEWLKKGKDLLEQNPLLLVEEAHMNVPATRKKLETLYRGCESYLIVI